MQKYPENKINVQENKKTQDQLLERTVDWRKLFSSKRRENSGSAGGKEGSGGCDPFGRKRVTFHHVRGRAVEALGVNNMLFSAVQCHKEFTAEREVEESTPDSDR
ncbi:MAG: hypothetical protein IJ794_12080 [Lachnospiraceae bacterium]|nr:hypothetical protein [Lachnospiraceae bacterium]MBR1853858.1 hypothetical protein [Lachnospiraceae bacterium]